MKKIKFAPLIGTFPAHYFVPDEFLTDFTAFIVHKQPKITFTQTTMFNASGKYHKIEPMTVSPDEDCKAIVDEFNQKHIKL